MPLKTQIKMEEARKFLRDSTKAGRGPLAEYTDDIVPPCPPRVVVDHISGMTDRYALDLYDRLRL